ncbi:MAG: hypothetical protein ACE5GD_07595 [Candidatus Geothermarchaeales archaeon]
MFKEENMFAQPKFPKNIEAIIYLKISQRFPNKVSAKHSSGTLSTRETPQNHIKTSDFDGFEGVRITVSDRDHP